MAREKKSWFVGFDKKTTGSTTITATATSRGREAGHGDVAQLTNQLSVGANIGGIDPEKERDPPARATSLVFPEVKQTDTARWSDDHPPPNLQALFASIQRPEVYLTEHLRALNCDHPVRPGQDQYQRGVRKEGRRARHHQRCSVQSAVKNDKTRRQSSTPRQHAKVLDGTERHGPVLGH